MSWFASARVLALSALLATAPVLPSVTETAPVALTLAQQTDSSIAAALERPRAVSSAFDVAAFNALLGGEARLGFKSAGPDTATGAYRLTGVSFELTGDEPMTLFTADELLIWNTDFNGVAARFDGQSLDETIRVFDRIELSGVKLDMMDYTDAVEDAMVTAVPDAAASMVDYQDGSIEVGRLVLSGLTLHPWTLTETEGEDQGLAAIRLISAAARSFSLDAAVFLDTTINQTFTDAGASGSLATSYESQILKGYDRGNIAALLNGKTKLVMDIPVPPPGSPAMDFPVTPAGTPPASDYTANAAEDEAASPGEPILVRMDGSTGYAGWTDIQLANLLSWGERGELPPITERDLWSFGNYVIEDMQFSLGGQPAFSMARFDLQADSFDWFLPTRISWSHEDLTFDLGGVMKAIEPLAGDQPSAEGEPSIPEIIAVLERTGLSKFSGDGTFELSWNSETGNALLATTSVTDNLYTDDTRLAMRLPSYADLVPAFGDDGLTPDSEQLNELILSRYALIGGHYTLSDVGLLNAISSAVIEISKISGSEDPMMAGFAGMTPDGLRSTASGLLMFAGAGAAAELPQALDWVKSLSAFVGSGGTFSIRMAPEKEVTPADFAAIAGEGMAEEPDMAALVDLVGLTVVHIPPAPVAAGTP
jgi:hypothetical protein